MYYAIAYFIIGYIIGLYDVYKNGYKYIVLMGPECAGLVMIITWPLFLVTYPFKLAYKKSKK